MFEEQVEFGGHNYEVKLRLDESDGKIRGSIKGLKEVRVVWEPGKFEFPWCSMKGQAARVHARGILLAAVDGLISDNPTPQKESRGEPIQNYVSQLITKGHVRRPCWMRIHGHTVLRAGCVVNAANMGPEELAAAEQTVMVWNTMCKARGKPLTWDEFRKEANDG